jgi:hypothetical protein
MQSSYDFDMLVITSLQALLMAIPEHTATETVDFILRSGFASTQSSVCRIASAMLVAVKKRPSKIAALAQLAAVLCTSASPDSALRHLNHCI